MNEEYTYNIIMDNNNNNDGVNDGRKPIMVEVNGTNKYSPPQISCLILQHLTTYAAKKLEIDPKKTTIDAVITVPAKFNLNQREQTKIAGNLYVD